VPRYSGVDKKTRAKEGVGLIILEELARSIIKSTAINSRIIRLNTELKEEQIIHIQIHAHKEDRQK
jgi:hypothetical protein